MGEGAKRTEIPGRSRLASLGSARSAPASKWSAQIPGQARAQKASKAAKASGPAAAKRRAWWARRSTPASDTLKTV
jgi:hypothetical protein